MHMYSAKLQGCPKRCVSVFSSWHLSAVSDPLLALSRFTSSCPLVVAYLTQAQGSVNAPLVWGRIVALTARITQAVLGDARYRLQYGDAPIVVTAGTRRQRDRAMQRLQRPSFSGRCLEYGIYD